MASSTLFVLVYSLLVSFTALAASIPEKKKYIVYLGDKPHPSVNAIDHHHRLLSDILGSHDAAKESIFHSYTLSMNAFAAKLSGEEAAQVAELDGVVSVFPAHSRKLQTTRTWDFLGFPETAPHNIPAESDVIVGVIDSGIDPFSPSFNDTGFGPPPARWSGKCSGSHPFKCNNKLIGAQWFRLDGKAPENDFKASEDYIGHGTHVASTAAGSAVMEANLYGMAKGTARGGAPSARIAAYKACFADGMCHDEDILAAFDTAISDGVDVINLSVGDDPGKSFTDSLAVGAYHAMRRGVLTVASAGNLGPMHRTVVNYSPWMLTVGASTDDRRFRTDLVLGNGRRITGVSVNTFESQKGFRPLVLGIDAAVYGMSFEAQMCAPESMVPTIVNGSIVLCKVTGNAGGKDEVVKLAGGVGLVLQLTMPIDQAETFLIPATIITKEAGAIIKEYIESLGPEGKPVARIEKSHDFTGNGVYVPSFSARGPNPLYTEILKPDLVAPGMNILAAYPNYLPFSDDPTDTRRFPFQTMSGTSMSTPHVTGAAAYLKSFHPTWSPASLRSALMTTARPIPPSKSPKSDLEYSYGSGQIDPLASLNPGLLYDLTESSYLRFLCSKHPNTTAVAILTASRNFDCSPFSNAKGYDALNYPTFHYIVPDSAKSSVATYRRIVTNVGQGPAVYEAIVEAPPGVEIEVSPAKLEFRKVNEKKSFSLVVRVAAINGRPPYIVSGSLVWCDGVHRVRSPIAIHYT